MEKIKNIFNNYWHLFSWIVVLTVITSGITTRNEKEQPVVINIDTTSAKFTAEQLVRATSYNPDIAQTDSTPLATADGSVIDTNRINNLRWCAVSQDMLVQFGGKFSFGDTIYICPMKYDMGNKYMNRVVGRWIIHDTMNARMKKSMDFLCSTGYIKGVFSDILIVKVK